MGRNRKINKDDILDAAERVVVRLGAAGLSIDAVAQEAGVSKATVVYDHKSKAALLEAMIDRQVNAELKRIEVAVEEHSDAPHPALFGRIAVSSALLDDTDKAVTMAISASMSSDENLQKRMRDWTAADLKAMEDGPKPLAAVMAYLALTGFYCTEMFDFHSWTEPERAEILEAIKTIYLSFPDTT